MLLEATMAVNPVPAKSDSWDVFVAKLSPTAAAWAAAHADGAVPRGYGVPPDDDELYYADFTDQLSDAAKAIMVGPAVPEPVTVPLAASRFILIEAPDGEWPQQRLFQTAEGLARRVADLEGQDIAVTACWGTPLPLTKGVHRYILLPDGRAVTIPVGNRPAKIISACDMDPDVEIDVTGYLGPAVLAEASPLRNIEAAEEEEDDTVVSEEAAS
jgi:alkanesulfonate monooxygenase SsuD/methylene tetrahydromethanopterin reductase-like flavin-dependent oxidoreductase (luciferase family)